MAGVSVSYSSRCPKCGTSYEGTDPRAFKEFAEEHRRHGVQTLYTSRCSGCGASAQAIEGRTFMDFIKEHAPHEAPGYCPRCGSKLPFMDQEGTCPGCGVKVSRSVKVTTSVNGKRRHGFFSR